MNAPPGHKIITEGQASIIFSESNEVFYNKVQELNRDVSIEFIKLFAEKRLRESEEKAIKKSTPKGEEPNFSSLAEVDWTLRCKDTASEKGLVILDALAATALRSCRYAKEIPGVKTIVVNDLDEAAVEAAKKNISFNQIPEGKIETHVGDANLFMMQNPKKFDVVDIDPYGSASPHMDSAVQAVVDGGLLCLTCTDLAVLSGGNPASCFARYGSMPIKGKYLHEMALRIVLHAIESAATKYKRHIFPLASLGIDFYVRVFVRIFDSPSGVLDSCLKRGYVYQSLGCPTFFIQPMAREKTNGHACGHGPVADKCPQTGKEFKIGGPMWTSPIHDKQFVQELLQRLESQKGPFVPGTEVRLHGLLTSVTEELEDVPLFYSLPELVSTLHCDSPKIFLIKNALSNAGYRVSHFHKEPNAIKTDAPPQVIWDILRCWVKDHPINKKRQQQPDSASQMILSKEPELQANFSRPKNFKQQSKTAKRFLPNPEPFWGPKCRAKSRKLQHETVTEGNSLPQNECANNSVDEGIAPDSMSLEGNPKSQDDSQKGLL